MNGKSPVNPYAAGVLLGLVLTLSYLILGTGLGASSAGARLGAVLLRPFGNANGYFASLGEYPLHYYLVAMFLGIFLGGAFSAWVSHRWEGTLERGQKASQLTRILFSFLGGILVGWGSRVAGGCTSGQALSGGALMLTGSLLFMGCVFLGGYLTAPLFRRQWND